MLSSSVEGALGCVPCSSWWPQCPLKFLGRRRQQQQQSLPGLGCAKDGTAGQVHGVSELQPRALLG